MKTERDQSVGGGFAPGPLNIRVGDRIDYQIVVTNTSQEPLTVTLDDPGCRIRGGATLHFTGIQMAAGQSLTYHCSHVIAAADGAVYTNTATANGVSSSASAAPVSSSVKANVAHVLGAKKVLKPTVVHHKAAKKVVKHKAAPKKVTKVTKQAHPAKPVVKGASYTG